MEKFIKIYDDLLPPLLVNQIKELLLNNNPPGVTYAYLENITGKDLTEFYFPGFNYTFIDITQNLYSPHHHLLSQVLYKLSDHLNFSIKNIIAARSFLQTPSLDPIHNNIHIDLPYPHWVCLYYVTDSDGDTILFDDNNNEIQRVTPKKGRIVFFDGSIKHCASPPTKNTRSIINFDFIGEKLG